MRHGHGTIAPSVVRSTARSARAGALSGRGYGPKGTVPRLLDLRLLVGLARRRRQAWVWLTGRIARDHGAGPRAGVGELPLATMREWRAGALQGRYREVPLIELQQPLPPLPGSGRL